MNLTHICFKSTIKLQISQSVLKYDANICEKRIINEEANDVTNGFKYRKKKKQNYRTD